MRARCSRTHVCGRHVLIMWHCHLAGQGSPAPGGWDPPADAKVTPRHLEGERLCGTPFKYLIIWGRKACKRTRTCGSPLKEERKVARKPTRICLLPARGPQRKYVRTRYPLRIRKSSSPATLLSSDCATKAAGADRWVFSTLECYKLLLYFLILFLKRKKWAQVSNVDSWTRSR